MVIGDDWDTGGNTALLRYEINKALKKCYKKQYCRI